MHSGDRPKDTEEWMRRVERNQQELESRLRGMGSISAAGIGASTSDGTGRASFLYGRTFPGLVAVTATGVDGIGVTLTAVTTTGFTCEFRNTETGVLRASLPVQVHWRADAIT